MVQHYNSAGTCLLVPYQARVAHNGLEEHDGVADVHSIDDGEPADVALHLPQCW